MRGCAPTGKAAARRDGAITHRLIPFQYRCVSLPHLSELRRRGGLMSSHGAALVTGLTILAALVAAARLAYPRA
ncbi:hypothetical protein XFF6166_50009 [Xanthomonas citri pv. fuscans]|nr:hypothetical protein XFF6166_50009 [Xanthomonas citri pv. fuscans]SON99055.1 hypothetical protein XFF6960_120009 [Xanthomonas citri pv. fuscans]SOO04028.1 hypothetical protein XFF7767_210042 [Xanthomonas citri pv. fuscans]SOO09183.1 hypothetical protein XFF6970_320040 [Xanthomonas citri pv. fuscans]SOO44732.1 hypothetical protein XFF1815_620010 [Xanthomonas citri pv. fuscans]